MNFSVLISTYKKENPKYLDEALCSIWDLQTIKPSEIVLVKDGPLSEELDIVIDTWKKRINEKLNVIELPKNVGLGLALKIGLQECRFELVARMDTDDISVNNRFEKQLRYFKENPTVDIVGGYIYEFIDVIENVIGIRGVPTSDIKIKKYLRKRSPFNHVTVMFKKEAVLVSGNYQEWYCYEDYYLWSRMLINNHIFGNIPENLVYVRVGKNVYARRGGWKYYKSVAKLHKFMLENKIIKWHEYLYNVLNRFVVQILMPNKIRSFMYQKLLRKNLTNTNVPANIPI